MWFYLQETALSHVSLLFTTIRPLGVLCHQSPLAAGRVDVCMDDDLTWNMTHDVMMMNTHPV